MYPYRNFPLFYRIFPQNTKTFRKTNKRSLEIPKSSPIRRCVRRTEDYPILKTFLIYFKLRRFGGVGAPEGLENVPEICTKLFGKTKKKSVFLAEYVGYITKKFAKILKIGALTCDFLADVEG